ncbi:MAG: hypothetical protein WCT08_04305 [Patescibacteria group bacterium]|jgi:hypothetical protein
MSILKIYQEKANILKKNNTLLVIWLVILMWNIVGIVVTVVGMIGSLPDFAPKDVGTAEIITGVATMLFLTLLLGIAVIIGVFNLKKWTISLLGLLAILGLISLNIITILTGVIQFGLYWYLYKEYQKLTGDSRLV